MSDEQPAVVDADRRHFARCKLPPEMCTACRRHLRRHEPEQRTR